ncbi:MAG: heavy metal translocating P-type ATPase [Eubacteriales bacterium]
MKLSKRQKKDALRIGISLILLILGLILSRLLVGDGDTSVGSAGYFISLACFLPAFLVAGYKTLASAVGGLLRGQMFDENLLMSVASVAAVVMGEFLEGVAVMLFSQVGNLFEDYATGNARGAVAQLAKLCPDTVNLIRDGETVTVPSEQVEPGDLFVVGAGERIALDGKVEEGSASLDCSSMTGESLPVEVAVGDEVTSGTINLDGMLKIRALRTAEQSGAARTIAMVEDAAMKKSKTEAFISKFALWYTPLVVIGALIVALLPPFIVGDLTWGCFREWIYRALNFLVISCPCALVISVPLTFFGSVGGSAKRGILFKDNSKLETLAKVQTVAFDKTGTLTKGQPCVDRILPAGVGEQELLTLCAAAEWSSIHPLALAIQTAAGKDAFDPADVGEIHEVRGRGRKILYRGQTVIAGNAAFLLEESVEIPEDHQNLSTTAVYCARGGEYIGALTFVDQVKTESKAAIEELKNRGIRTVMLSGDSERAAKETAAALGIDDCRASLMPGDKVHALEEFIGSGVTAFVGDGINDSPSLARADIGFAMGSSGSDAAIEAADVVLVGDNPRKVAQSIRIACRTMSIAKENIVFALGVKLLVLILSVLGLANMWMAVFADVGVSVLAILNAMRTLRGMEE